MSVFGLRTTAAALAMVIAASPSLAAEAAHGYSQAAMKATLREYFAAFNANDMVKIKSLLADGATVEDPVGAPLKQATDFYDRYAKVKIRFDILMMTATDANTAAMAANVQVRDAAPHGVIEVFTFNAAGKITSMKAWHGTDDPPTPLPPT